MDLFRTRFLLALLIVSIAFALLATASPLPKPQDIEMEMRQIPQTHCLRFRKFDLIKRCRRYRIRRHR